MSVSSPEAVVAQTSTTHWWAEAGGFGQATLRDELGKLGLSNVRLILAHPDSGNERVGVKASHNGRAVGLTAHGVPFAVVDGYYADARFTGLADEEVVSKEIVDALVAARDILSQEAAAGDALAMAAQQPQVPVM